MADTCAGCLSILPKREFLTCLQCKAKYDLECANISLARFNNAMDKENKRNWKCQYCKCKMPKVDNTNTPVRSQNMTSSGDNVISQSISNENNNITLRKKPSTSKLDSSLLLEDDHSVWGDTITDDKNEYKALSGMDSITIKQLEVLLERKLEENKQNLLLELKTTLISDITNTIINEITQKINILYTEQKNLKDDVVNLDTHINELNDECIRLKTEIKEIRNQIEAKRSEGRENEPKFEYSKTFILYGIDEYNGETEYELHDRVIHIFKEVLRVNLTGYIEDISRIGRKGYRRPLKIELLSKKMVKYLLENKLFFKNTGLAISEILDKNALQQRKLLIEAMHKARQNGQHCIIKNNKLIINGQICNNMLNLKQHSLESGKEPTRKKEETFSLNRNISNSSGLQRKNTPEIHNSQRDSTISDTSDYTSNPF